MGRYTTAGTGCSLQGTALLEYHLEYVQTQSVATHNTHRSALRMPTFRECYQNCVLFIVIRIVMFILNFTSASALQVDFIQLIPPFDFRKRQWSNQIFGLISEGAFSTTPMTSNWEQMTHPNSFESILSITELVISSSADNLRLK